MEKDKLKEILGYILNYGLNPAILIFTTPMITKLVSPTEFGLYNFYQALIGVISVFLFSWLPAIVTRYLNINFENYIYNKKAFYIILKNILLIYILIFIIILFFNRKLEVLLLLLNQLFIFLVDLKLTFYQTNQQIKIYSIVNIIRNIGCLLIILLFNYYEIKSIYILFIGNLFFNVIYILYILKKRKSKVLSTDKTLDKTYFLKKDMLKFALPLIGINFSALILNLGDRIIMKYLLPNSEYFIGIYSMNYNIYSKIILIIISALTAIIPSTLYISFEKKGEEEYKKELKKLIQVYLLLTLYINIFLYFNYNNLNYLLLSEKYLLKNNLPILILNAYIYYGLYILMGNYLSVIKKMKYINFFIIFSGVLNILLNIIFLNKFGFTFCALSTLICFYLNFILLEIFFRIKLKIKILNKKIIILSNINLILVYLSYLKFPSLISKNKLFIITYFFKWGIFTVIFLGILIKLYKLKKSRSSV